MADNPETPGPADGEDRSTWKQSMDVACLTNSQISDVAKLRDEGKFFWLDLRAATDGEIADVGEELGLHPLTIEDLQHFDQRAKVEEFPNYIYLVSYGAAPAGDDDRLAEVHIVYSKDFILTVAHDHSVELRELHKQAEERKFTGYDMLHAVLDSLVDSYAPLLDEIDDEVDAIEDLILNRELKGRDRDIHMLRRRLGRVNRIVHRQSEAYTRLHEALRRLPDHDPTTAPYFRDVQDHLIRVTESADTLRERLSGTFEIYLAALDNRQNVIMKQFTVIAGVFLPLSVITGFFGMNFGWMVGHILHLREFLILGVGFPVLILSVILFLIYNRGLLSE